MGDGVPLLAAVTLLLGVVNRFGASESQQLSCSIVGTLAGLGG